MDNSAYRLLKILESGSKIPQGTLAKDAWITVLGVTNNDQSLLFHRIGQFYSLVEEASETVLQFHADEINAVNHWKPQIMAGLSRTQMGSPWSNFMGVIDSHSFSYLRAHSKLIPDLDVASKPLATASEEIRKETQSLLDLIIKSSLPSDVKDYFRKMLCSIINAIEESFINGSYGIYKEASRLYGELFLNGHFRAAISTQNKYFKDSFWEYASRISDILQISSAAAPLLPAVGAFLLGTTSQ